ncbi:MAG: alpha/beta hydrolase [Candidatus Heimdallarchaeota archaeon]
MDPIAIATLVLSLVLFLILVLQSFSLFGLMLSELGLWLSWMPITLLVFSLLYITRNVEVMGREYDLLLMFVSMLMNFFTSLRLIIPYFETVVTNRQFKKQMQVNLGYDYEHYIKSSLCVSFFSCTKFKLRFYYSGIRAKFLENRVTTINDLTYHTVDDLELKLNVHYPKEEGTFPIIILVHGGGWVVGSKDRLTHVRTSKILAGLGYTVYNIDYRLIPPEIILDPKTVVFAKPVIAEMIEDVLKAIRFAKEHTNEHKGNPDDIFLFGRSAGAHLVLLTSFLADESQKLSGIIAFYPVTDLEGLYQFYRKSHPLKTRLLQNKIGTPENYHDFYKIFSPMNYIDDDATTIPPVFIVTGKRDRLVDPRQSIKLYNKLQQYNIPSVLLELPWANHAFDFAINGPGGQISLKYLSQFLAWVLGKKEVAKTELLGQAHGLEDIVSQEKIRVIYKHRKPPIVDADFENIIETEKKEKLDN